MLSNRHICISKVKECRTAEREGICRTAFYSLVS